MRVECKGSCSKQDKITCTPGNAFNLFIIFELGTQSLDLDVDFSLKDCLFGAIKLTKNADPDKKCYSGNTIEFDFRYFFSLPNFDWCKNAIIFGIGNSSPLHVDKKKDILVLAECPTQKLDDTTIRAEATYSINFTRSKVYFCLSLHYNGNISFLFM